MKLLLLGFAGLVVMQCQQKPADAPATFPSQTDTTTVVDIHTSQNSLDYLGRYKGVLPCADCPGIETTLELTEDFHYSLTQVYQERNVKPLTETGTFRWNPKGDGIILSGSGDRPTQYKVQENKLVQLDVSGNEITGTLADKFVLTKLSTSEAVKDISGSQPQTMEGKWLIAELNGKSLKKTGSKDNTFEFRGGRVSAYAGCNSMGGEYTVKGSTLKMGKVMSTMMACPDMSAEDELKVAIERVDEFVRNDKTLLLRSRGEVIIKLTLL